LLNTLNAKVKKFNNKSLTDFYFHRENIDLEDMHRKEMGDLKIKLQVSTLL
jgi:hypothetical protein